jgi:hypothetical protein
MIVYRVELWCDGCMRSHVRSMRYHDRTKLTDAAYYVIERAELDHHWITDGLEHYCPQCQVQRKAG